MDIDYVLVYSLAAIATIHPLHHFSSRTRRTKIADFESFDSLFSRVAHGEDVRIAELESSYSSPHYIKLQDGAACRPFCRTNVRASL
jgi:hypothetical protein